jgi:hypothetical protein
VETGEQNPAVQVQDVTPFGLAQDSDLLARSQVRYDIAFHQDRLRDGHLGIHGQYTTTTNQTYHTVHSLSSPAQLSAQCCAYTLLRAEQYPGSKIWLQVYVPELRHVLTESQEEVKSFEKCASAGLLKPFCLNLYP